MIQKILWRPDTCKCVIEQVFDIEGDVTTHLEAQDTVVEKCASHAQAADEAVCGNVLDENRRKNVVLREVDKRIPMAKKMAIRKIETPLGAMVREATQEEIDAGQAEIFVPSELAPSWSFDENRTLTVRIPLAANLDVNNIDPEVAAKFTLIQE